MKKLKRLLIFPLYIWHYIVTKNHNSFDYWLARKYPKLANGWYFIVPKNYKSTIAKYPDKLYIPLNEIRTEIKHKGMFYWHETNQGDNSL